MSVVRTDASEEHVASIFRVEQISELGTLAISSKLKHTARNAGFNLLVTANVVPSTPIPSNLKMDSILYFGTSFLRRPTRRNAPEDDILHSDSRGNLKSYIALTG
jgi:hypothetical protein